MEPLLCYIGLYAWVSLFHWTDSRVVDSNDWSNSLENQYHIQTDEGEERYFKYQTKSGQYRKEKRLPDGTVIGTYGWVDSNGYLRLQDYIADDQGYRILKTKLIYVGEKSSEGEGVSGTTYPKSSLLDKEGYFVRYGASSPGPGRNAVHLPSFRLLPPPHPGQQPYYETAPISDDSNLDYSSASHTPTFYLADDRKFFKSPIEPFATVSENSFRRHLSGHVATNYNKPYFRDYENDNKVREGGTFGDRGQLYDGISTKQNGFRYYLPRQYHEEMFFDDARERVGSFGYVDPFGIRRVIYYKTTPESGFLHKKSNRYVGINAAPHD